MEELFERTSAAAATLHISRHWSNKVVIFFTQKIQSLRIIGHITIACIMAARMLLIQGLFKLLLKVLQIPHLLSPSTCHSQLSVIEQILLPFYWLIPNL